MVELIALNMSERQMNKFEVLLLSFDEVIINSGLNLKCVKSGANTVLTLMF